MTRLAKAFRYQAESCAHLGSPFMARLMGVLADHLTPDAPLTQRMFDWPGDLGPRGASVPLRLAGALHALRLAGDAGLMAVYPPHTPDDAALWAAVVTALSEHADFIDNFIDSPPQTNEVRRSAALIAGAHVVADKYPLPFVISELGSSAGLNLMWDHYALVAGQARLGPDNPAMVLRPEWRGPVPPQTHPTVAERRGVDLAPVRDAARLRAYLWPDQPDRMALTDAALSVMSAQVDQGDAIDWLATRLHPRPGHVHLIQHTVAWQYFPADAQTRGQELIEQAGAKATVDSPLAWLSLENDGAIKGAALTLRLWPGNVTLHLGRADFHGRWVDWRL